jgi:hypothetical protein
MTEKITSKQETHIADLVRDLVRALGLTKDEAQEIIANGGKLQTDLKPILQKLALQDQRFGPAIKEFELTVSADYKHDSQIDTFGKKTKKLKTTYYYNDSLTSENFAKATTKLEPRKTYKVKIFPIISEVTSEDCMNFLRKQNAILVGGQGLTLVHDLKSDEFPVNKWTVSFDEKNALWKDSDGLRRVPFLDRYSDGDWGFFLGRFGRDWDGDYCLLCFCDKEPLGT